jgi:putative ABC transport system ATP-binding protein
VAIAQRISETTVEHPVLHAQELYRFFHVGDDEVVALRGVSLTVRPGETIAVVGPSGSGKSTLLRCLAGLDEPDGGMVQVADRRITRRPEAERSALRARWIGVLQQSGNLLDHLTVRQNVTFARMFSDKPPSRDIDELLDEVGLGARADARPSRLSGGEAARAGLAVALANDPAVVLADEPTAEVDRANEDVVVELFHRRVAEGGSVVVITHSLRVAAACDRAVHMLDGRLVDA